MSISQQALIQQIGLARAFVSIRLNGNIFDETLSPLAYDDWREVFLLEGTYEPSEIKQHAITSMLALAENVYQLIEVAERSQHSHLYETMRQAHARINDTELSLKEWLEILESGSLELYEIASEKIVSLAKTFDDWFSVYVNGSRMYQNWKTLYIDAAKKAIALAASTSEKITAVVCLSNYADDRAIARMLEDIKTANQTFEFWFEKWKRHMSYEVGTICRNQLFETACSSHQWLTVAYQFYKTANESEQTKIRQGLERAIRTFNGWFAALDFDKEKHAPDNLKFFFHSKMAELARSREEWLLTFLYSKDSEIKKKAWERVCALSQSLEDWLELYIKTGDKEGRRAYVKDMIVNIAQSQGDWMLFLEAATGRVWQDQLLALKHIGTFVTTE